MKMPTVLVYGRMHRRSELERCIVTTFAGRTKVEFQDTFEPPRLELLRRTDVVLYFVEESTSSRETFVHLKKIVCAFSYLPTLVIVGDPDKNIECLGASRYLDRAATDQRISAETSRALQRTWWYGISQVNLPIMVVDRDAVVVRANAAARHQFGENVVGRFYGEAVEKGGFRLAETHPIRKVLDSTGNPVGVCQYHEFPRPSPDANRASLVCIPILGVRNRVEAVGVLFVSMDRWARIFQSAKHLGEVDTRHEMHEAIVREVKRLGYRRARLYELLPDQHTLKGRASVGFTLERDMGFQAKHGVDRAEFFRTKFEIQLTTDPPSRDTLGDRCFPALCVCRPDCSDDAAFSSDLERNYGNPRLHAFELDCEEIERWIDIPILVPALGEPNGVRKWGKLSVDDAENSGRLDVQDLADLTMFAAVASGHLAAVERAETHIDEQREQLDLFRRYAASLATGLRTATKGETVFKNRRSFVRALLVEMYQELTGADVVYFRRYRGLDPKDMLQLAGPAIWSNHSARERYEIPEVVERRDWFSARLLKRVDSEGQWMGPAEPLRVPGPNEISEPPPDSNANRRWTPKQWNFLKSHNSALHIPVIVSGEFRGAIIALNEGTREFKVDAPTVQRFMDTAALWNELGELQDDQLWLAQALDQILRYLPKLATAPDHENDKAFFACLADVLTAHVGLGWNRVWIFQWVAPGVVELVYAHGGTGEREHSGVRQQLKERFKDLGKLLDVRLKAPEPLRDDGTLDPLFELCVDYPRKEGRPIRIHFDINTEQKQGNLLANILAHDYELAPSLPIPQGLQLKREWFHGPKEFPDAMVPSGKIYPFPLRCMYSDQREPHGMVLLEMLYDPQRRLEGMKAATQLILGLAANILAFRHQQRRTLGMFKNLSVAEHGGTIVEEWDEFARNCKKILEKLVPRHDSPIAIPESLESVKMLVEGAANVPATVESGIRFSSAPIEGLFRSLDTMNERMNRLFKAQRVQKRVIDDVFEFVERALEPMKESGVCIVWREQPVQPIRLVCDRLVLSDAVFCIVQNACAAARQLNRRPELCVAVRERNFVPSDPFEKVVEIEFTDNGPGVPENRCDLIFHDGFSFWEKPARPAGSNAFGKTEKGKGLGLVRSQLRAFKGDLQLKNRGGASLTLPSTAGDKAANTGTIGATFTISFGISRIVKSETANAAQPLDSGVSNVYQTADR